MWQDQARRAFMIGRNFYEQGAKKLAKQLLGLYLIRRIGSKYWTGKIVETEAYLGEGDAASHAFRGLTPRNRPMFESGGVAYVYFTYGMHWLFNIVADKKGRASAVLIRALEPLIEDSKIIDRSQISLNELRKKGSGPARITRWLQIDGCYNNHDLVNSSEIFLSRNFKFNGKYWGSCKISQKDIIATTRIGIHYAGEDQKKPLRFYIKNNQFISRS